MFYNVLFTTGKICYGDGSAYDRRDQRNFAGGHSCWGPTSSDALWWPCVGSRQNGRKSTVKFQPYFQWPWHHQVPGWGICGRCTNLCGNEGEQTWSCKGTAKCFFETWSILLFLSSSYSFGSSWRNCSHGNATGVNYWEVNISSVMGLSTSGSTPLPGLMLTQLYVIMWHHLSTVGSYKDSFIGRHIIYMNYQHIYKKNGLTHLPLDKMATISQTIFSDAFLWMTSFWFWLINSLEFVPRGPIDNEPALI